MRREKELKLQHVHYVDKRSSHLEYLCQGLRDSFQLGVCRLRLLRTQHHTVSAEDVLTALMCLRVTDVDAQQSEFLALSTLLFHLSSNLVSADGLHWHKH